MVFHLALKADTPVAYHKPKNKYLLMSDGIQMSVVELHFPYIYWILKHIFSADAIEVPHDSTLIVVRIWWSCITNVSPNRV